MDFYQEITQLLLSNQITSKDTLHKTKIKLCKKYKINIVPPDSDILSRLPKHIPATHPAFALLQKKPMRTISGVAIVAVMTSPAPCPHGRCTPCPGGPDHCTPQSYTGHEPAALRADLHGFDPYQQTINRINQLQAIGHPTNKIDLIVMGGTFTARHPAYQEWFIRRCIDAFNLQESTSLQQAQHFNEHAAARCIGITIETRPDWFRLQHCDHCLTLGATRMEIGVQTIYDHVLQLIERGHTVTDTIYATRIAKDAGFKICYHLMPGLPDTTPEMDIEMIRTIFADARFKPDMLKLYPTLIMEDTKLYHLWKQHKYQPLTTSQAIQLIAQMKTYIPEWVRIQRIQRDIPAPLIKSGVTKSNLRQWVLNEMKAHGTQCRCIRCREIGHRSLTTDICYEDLSVETKIHRYEASGSTEIFLSIEDKKQDLLLGYLRLRDITQSHRSELSRHPCMLIRELKIVGKELPLGTHTSLATQHRGYGKTLINTAEKLCSEDFDKTKLFVLSGIGVKPYYRELGFKNKGIYLQKIIT
ncbi:MAG: tRNA uridine(34) 5-carboxymethylaminomethyl modification radical SAM/GNAT enzyme Elp3 [Candidatus Thermoplasmatota archaeon]|nr:tRNA uridine(34) 5-carboxymethylaminomethyl modification radical SAM/GNAT enzyme Elp3 [Candidatus Thermoplasmatota archaeon]MBU1942013.1 tRNA uridine(34) 5-carboxymethylaminomethyl modification radical SAM/GNAT enzyme Elp3 [Candidatus Thermoplasmatota archaeon]